MSTMTAAPLALTDEQRSALERMANSTSLAARQVNQARALLWAGEGVANEEIARRCGVDADAVRRWRRRFAETGVDGVGVIAKGRGRTSWLPEGTVAEVVRVTLEEAPDDTSTHWTTRSMAERLGIGKDTVARIWRDRHLQAVEGRDLQAVQRSPFRGEAGRRGRAVPEPARAGRGVLLRREDPVPGAGPDPAVSLPMQAGPGRDDDP